MLLLYQLWTSLEFLLSRFGLVASFIEYNINISTAIPPYVIEEKFGNIESAIPGVHLLKFLVFIEFRSRSEFLDFIAHNVSSILSTTR